MSINTSIFADALIANFGFFAGVPDSLLKDFCAALNDKLSPDKFVTTVNEGSAVAMCAGYTLATGLPGVVYMQNSGLGNAINPLLSLNDALVYRIPVLLVIGWRGEPDVKDEPQHKKQGLVTRELLNVCGIPWRVLSDVADIKWAYNEFEKNNSPVAILVKKDAFSKYEKIYTNKNELAREAAIEAVIDSLNCDYRIVSTTGMISRELYALREKRGESHNRDFLTVGAMGHSSAISLGLAMSLPDTKIICFDGDGAVLMHMGAMATIGSLKVKNLIHVVFNNEAHDSVGGQATVAGNVNLTEIAKSCGYSSACCVKNVMDLKNAVSVGCVEEGLHFIEIKVALRTDTDLMRPSDDLENLKNAFSKLKKEADK